MSVVAAAYVGMAGGAFVPPAPQLLKGVQMLIVGYKADRDTIASLLPPGLEPHESSLIQMNMYVCQPRVPREPPVDSLAYALPSV